MLDTVEGQAKLAASEIDVRTPSEVEKLHLHGPHLLPPRPSGTSPRARAFNRYYPVRYLTSHKRERVARKALRTDSNLTVGAQPTLRDGQRLWCLSNRASRSAELICGR
jgi:hypothetical protein